MMKSDYIKRLNDLEKVAGSKLVGMVDVIFKDGSKKRLVWAEAINLVLDNTEKEKIKEIVFLGDTSTQGILPDLLLCLLKN